MPRKNKFPTKEQESNEHLTSLTILEAQSQGKLDLVSKGNEIKVTVLYCVGACAIHIIP